MKRLKNLKEYKSELRAQLKELRRAMPPQEKEAADRAIAARLQRLSAWKRSGTVLIYVSTAIEVDTIALIDAALAQGKRVAVPRCVPGEREMEFYCIDSRDALVPGSFGILEPCVGLCERLAAWDNSICVVPALGCDFSGYRLGYGGGYYDRFLNRYPGKKAVILYNCCLQKVLWHGRYDVAVDFVVTEQGVVRSRKPLNDKKPLKGLLSARTMDTCGK